MRILSHSIAHVAALLSLAACGDAGDRLFELLPPDRTGVTFANTIATSDSLNVQTDVYVYNGAGVAAGDIDNDGLPDLFLSGNMVSSRLYLNKGGMRFEDITERAGVTTTRWATGATMVDINGDGYLDIYVSVSGPEWWPGARRANLLFVNNRDRTFREAAAQYGLADTNFTTHAAFLDYDRDGCIDVFLLNNSPTDFSRGSDVSHPAAARGSTPGSYNELYHNDCNGRFTDVSARAGILRDVGYGLGVAIGDLNRDGWPDIYVSNDATPNDVLYVNNGDGTFSNKAGAWLKHTSFAGMGVDIADVDNDGWPDILQADMLPSDMARRKRMSGFMTYGGMLESRARGYRDDYSENALQLSGGITPHGEMVFSDIARLAGVAGTDWSWSALLADFDNDGRKDAFISNGYPKAVNDLDYQTAMFAIRRGRDEAASRRRGLELLKALHAYDLPNFAFRNSGDLTFADRTKAWGMDRPSLSYGAAYVDLDNDGRLDLVVSNIDAPAFIYHNVGSFNDARHWLAVQLYAGKGHALDGAIGATLTLSAGGQKQYVYYSPYRGYMSTMDSRAHFGLGSAARVDTLEVAWPDGQRQVLTNLAADRVLVVSKDSAAGGNTGVVRHADARTTTAPLPPESQWFHELDGAVGLGYRHRVTTQSDYRIQPLLPYLISRQGPALAVGDVNGDGLDDVYVGGGGGASGRLFVQTRDGAFTAQSGPWEADAALEDWGALFFDANGDGRPDLYVASGGYQLAPGSALLQDRLYVNDGDGRFHRDTLALPAMLTSTAAVQAGDFDGDGRLDLFVGGRLAPRNYPFPTRSYILRNDGGRFTDVTEQVAPELARPVGMVTAAAWLDFDGDGRLDLVTAGEWMPLQFYRNEGQRFTNVTGATGLPSLRGWWFSLASSDLDGDGRPDLVAGNLGLNYPYSTSRESPFGVYAADFTGHQVTDVILTKTVDGTEYPFAGLVPLGREMYSVGLRFPSYGAFAQASITEVVGAAQLRSALHYQADTFASLSLHNDGGGRFTAVPLPNLAQIAPIRGIVPQDVNGDGKVDVIVAGNLYDAEPNTTRADAGNGLVLRNDGQGRLTPITQRESGFLAPRNVSGLARVRTANGMAIVVANTGDSVQVFALSKR